MPKKKKEIKTAIKKEQTEGLIQPRKIPRRTKKTLLEMQQTDGKLYNKKGVKSIDELLGVSSSKYITHDIKAYERFINNMNTSDLQTHAAQVGVMPNHDRNILTKRLLKEFRLSNSSFESKTRTPIEIPKKIRQETLDILSEGR